MKYRGKSRKQLENGKINISMMESYQVFFIFYPWSFERALWAKYKTNKATSVAANSLLIVWPCDEPCKTKNCKLTNVDCIQSKSLNLQYFPVIIDVTPNV